MNKKISDYEIDTMLKNYCARRSQIAFDASMEERKMTKRKGFRIATTAFALIAVLSAGIFTNFMFTGNDKAENHNGFFVTAYAAETTSDEATVITKEKFTPVCKIKPEMILEGTMNQSSKGTSPNVVGALLDLNFKCTGENIEKLTYSIDNGSFLLNGNDDSFFDMKKADVEGATVFVKDGKVYWHIVNSDADVMLDSPVGEKDTYSDFSVSYKDQNKIFEQGKTNFAPVEILGSFYNKTEKVMTDKQLYENMINNITVTVKANYIDGTTETEKIRLKCIYIDETDIMITAKIID
ncbi:MAG: hypothetical protein ACI4RM_03565 [Ruminococcus sp.]